MVQHTLFDEVYEAADLVKEVVDPSCNIIFGSGIDEGMNDEVEITIIATGFNTNPLQEDVDLQKSKEEVKAYGGFDREKYDKYIYDNNAMGINRGRLGEMDRQKEYVEPRQEEVRMQETENSSRITVDRGEIPPFLRKIKRDRN